MNWDDQVKLKIATGDDVSVREFTVDESLNHGFVIDLVVLSKNHSIDLEAVTGQLAVFGLRLDGLEVSAGVPSAAPKDRVWNGVARAMRIIRSEPAGLSTYEVEVVPRLWLMTRRVQHRVFHDKTIPDLVKELLGVWSVDFATDLKESYRVHEMIVQYGESDFSFISRLLEEAGISYYFKFPGCQMILCDHPEQAEFRMPSAIRYQREPQTAKIEHVSDVRTFRKPYSNVVTLRDYDFRQRPDFELQAEKQSGEQFPPLAEYTFRHGEFLEEGLHQQGVGTERVARVLDAHATDRFNVEYSTNVIDLWPGHKFSINGHPLSALDAELLVTGCKLTGSQGADWAVEGRAVLGGDRRIVPERTAPKPTVPGVQSAVVVGPPGEEIHVDQFGRIKVQFLWDREGKWDDKSSCWVRVSQQWAGPAYGFLLLPRVGQEVLLGFLDGDPDMPVVVGRVYNGESRVPYKLPDYKTRSTWRSQSTPGGNGWNEIMFEDEKGMELVYMQAQKDLKKVVKEEETERTNKNRNLVVGKNSQEIIAKLDATLVGKRHVTEIIKYPLRTPVDELHILEQDAPDVRSKKTKLEMKHKRLIFTTGKASVVFDDKDIYFEADADIHVKAQTGEMFIEGSTVYVNTITPPPAPKPDDCEQMQPGLFKFEKTDP